MSRLDENENGGILAILCWLNYRLVLFVGSISNLDFSQGSFFFFSSASFSVKFATVCDTL